MNYQKPPLTRKPVDDVLAMLAELFPNCFAAERWQVHKPLKVGIHLELAGLLTPKELRALAVYTRRRAYQAALAAGGQRYGLTGDPCGAVTEAEQEAAVKMLARLDAKALAEAAAARAAHKAGVKPVCKRSAGPRRLGLADLKAAAAARRAALIEEKPE